MRNAQNPSACGPGGAARLAVKAYMDGEAALDAGHTQKGIKFMRRAIDMEAGLDQEEWPERLLHLRAGLEHLANHPPPQALADLDLKGFAMNEEQSQFVASRYEEQHFVILDNAIPMPLCDQALHEIAREDIDEGGLELSTVYASPSSSAISVAVPERRSDRIRYLPLGEEEAGQRWAAVSEAVARMDAIAKGLRERLPGELGDIVSRQRPMVSAYDEGAKFERHCDNHCSAGDQARGDHSGAHAGDKNDEDGDPDGYDPDYGYCANRRRLSAVLYCVPEDWSAAHGGALRVYKPVGETGGWEGDDALVDVVPRKARLIFFASDQRCPHEVLPVCKKGVVRYALALWFLAPPSAPLALPPHKGKKGPTAMREERLSATSVLAQLD